MGGLPKGMLEHPSGSGTLVDHVLALAGLIGGEPVLVGLHDAYAGLGIRRLGDVRAGAGPLSGLASLLAAAGDRNAFAIACDLPFLPVGLLRSLQSSLTPDADAAMPLRSTGREPLCALYRAPRVLPHVLDAMEQGKLSLRALSERLHVVDLPLVGVEERWLDDWDTPQDTGLPF
jgi:molybdopterin-guanine dinucleotide biosynthesis protein A